MSPLDIIVANWKMNLTVQEGKALAKSLLEITSALKKTAVWIAPAFTAIPALSPLLEGSNIKLGAQNAHWEDKGAFTGEVSALMLREFGCTFSIIGHSERRHVFNESLELCAKRGAALLKKGMTVIFCIGETLEQKELGVTFEILEAQLNPLLGALDSDQVENLLIAYEPVWAIGTGKVASIEDIDSAHSWIDFHIRKMCGGRTLKILYGGSVTPENFQAVLQRPLVAGSLVGGASLIFEKMQKLIAISEGF